MIEHSHASEPFPIAHPSHLRDPAGLQAENEQLHAALNSLIALVDMLLAERRSPQAVPEAQLS